MEPITKNELLRWLNKLVNPSGNQLYLHFKGKLVLKTGESTCSEDGHTNYLYRELEVIPGNISLGNTLWSRPMGMFLEKIYLSRTLPDSSKLHLRMRLNYYTLKFLKH